MLGTGFHRLSRSLKTLVLLRPRGALLYLVGVEKRKLSTRLKCKAENPGKRAVKDSIPFSEMWIEFPFWISLLFKTIFLVCSLQHRQRHFTLRNAQSILATSRPLLSPSLTHPLWAKREAIFERRTRKRSDVHKTARPTDPEKLLERTFRKVNAQTCFECLEGEK